VATDLSLAYLVTVDGDAVSSRPDPDPGAVGGSRATITGTARDLLALLLGRPLRGELVRDGDVPLAEAFVRAFPGP
jgi:hypothetical protein